MKLEPTLYVTDRAKWRKWLEKNHVSSAGIWLIYYKKESGKPRIAYDDAVEEAICFGWIDSIIKRIDDEKFAQKFTPRTNVENWSALNCGRVQKLKAAGLLMPAGLAKIPQSVLDGAVAAERLTRPEPKMHPEFKKALAGNAKASAYFETLAPSYRRPYLWWTGSAKREETLKRRIAEAMALLEKGRKLPMK
jgi:uncharacterized protein YdeI (YjbR/CyaY-like superfamily)